MVATASVAISAEFVLVASYEAFISLLWVYRSRNSVSVDPYAHSIGFKLFTYTPAIDICYAGSRYAEVTQGGKVEHKDRTYPQQHFAAQLVTCYTCFTRNQELSS